MELSPPEASVGTAPHQWAREQRLSSWPFPPPSTRPIQSQGQSLPALQSISGPCSFSSLPSWASSVFACCGPSTMLKSQPRFPAQATLSSCCPFLCPAPPDLPLYKEQTPLPSLVWGPLVMGRSLPLPHFCLSFPPTGWF